MATTNPITGDSIQTKVNSDAYRNNYDAIFGKSKQTVDADKQKKVEDKIEEEKQAVQVMLKAVSELNK